ncbi:hypothetical protein Aperf_G00000022894 [Anoplocephala perfoliata]
MWRSICRHAIDFARPQHLMDGVNRDNKGAFERRSFGKMLREEDISNILAAQQGLLSRLEKTNAMLQTVNELSSQRLESLTCQLRSYARLLVSMKRELNTILKRTDSIKKNLKCQYPPEYQEAANVIEAAWKAELEAGSETPSPPQKSTTFSPSMGPLTE